MLRSCNVCIAVIGGKIVDNDEQSQFVNKIGNWWEISHMIDDAVDANAKYCGPMRRAWPPVPADLF